jgi:hypothetical protein
MLLSPKGGAYAAWVSVAGGLSQFADVYHGNSGPPGDQLGQVRQIGGHYQDGRELRAEAASGQRGEHLPVDDDAHEPGQNGDPGGSGDAVAKRPAGKHHDRQQGESDHEEQDRGGAVAKPQLVGADPPSRSTRRAGRRPARTRSRR